MDDPIRRGLARGHRIDITTTGRTTGLPRRIEIYFENIDGRIYISGMPNPARKRDWLRNLEADPRLTFHLKHTVAADLPARARVVTEDAERRSILARFAETWRRPVEPMVESSPLIEVVFDEGAIAAA